MRARAVEWKQFLGSDVDASFGGLDGRQMEGQGALTKSMVATWEVERQGCISRREMTTIGVARRGERGWVPSVWQRLSEKVGYDRAAIGLRSSCKPSAEGSGAE